MATRKFTLASENSTKLNPKGFHSVREFGLYFELNKRLLTRIKMSNRPVVVQFGLHVVIPAIHFNPFSVVVDGVIEIPISVCIISFVLVNLCYC